MSSRSVRRSSALGRAHELRARSAAAGQEHHGEECDDADREGAEDDVLTSALAKSAERTGEERADRRQHGQDHVVARVPAEPEAQPPPPALDGLTERRERGADGPQSLLFALYRAIDLSFAGSICVPALHTPTDPKVDVERSGHLSLPGTRPARSRRDRARPSWWGPRWSWAPRWWWAPRWSWAPAVVVAWLVVVARLVVVPTVVVAP